MKFDRQQITPFGPRKFERLSGCTPIITTGIESSLELISRQGKRNRLLEFKPSFLKQ